MSVAPLKIFFHPNLNRIVKSVTSLSDIINHFPLTSAFIILLSYILGCICPVIHLLIDRAVRRHHDNVQAGSINIPSSLIHPGQLVGILEILPLSTLLCALLQHFSFIIKYISWMLFDFMLMLVIRLYYIITFGINLKLLLKKITPWTLSHGRSQLLC